MRQLRNNDGFLLLVFVLAIVVASFAITTALLNINSIETKRREVFTWQKMRACAEDLGVHEFRTNSETVGAGMSYLNEEGTFPNNMSTFVGNNYLWDFGMSSSLYSPDLDAFGDQLNMQSAGGIFTISSDNISQHISITESMYTGNDIVVLVKDLTSSGDETSSMPYYPGDALDNTYVKLIGTPRSGIYDMDGNRIQTLAYNAVSQSYSLTGLTVGCYELIIVEDAAAHGTWMQDAIGVSQARFYLIVYPITSGGSNSIVKCIRFPFQVIES